MREEIYTETELNELCARYQPFMKLLDWSISVRLVPQKKIKKMSGRIHWSMLEKSAVVLLPTHETFKSVDPILYPHQNMRLSLLHELVHLMFCLCAPRYEKNSLQDDLWESAIESVAQGFMSLFDLSVDKVLPHGVMMPEPDLGPVEHGPQMNDSDGYREDINQMLKEDGK